MSWLSLTLLSVIVSSCASILQRVLMKGDKSDPYAYSIIFHLLLGVLVFAFALLRGDNTSPLSGDVFMLLLASALWGACQVFLFKALQLMEASEVSIISDIRVIVTVIASVILLNETFTGLNVIGTLLILGSTLLVINPIKGFKANKGLLYTLAMAVIAGLAIVADSANVQRYDVLTYSAFSNLLSGLFIWAFYPRALREWKGFVQPTFLKKMLPLALFSATQGVLYLYALSYGGNTAQVGTIRQASVIVTVLLAAIFLHERKNMMHKCAAALITTAGVFLLR